MPYTATLQLRAKVQPNIKVKAQGLGEMISIRVSLGSTTFLNSGPESLINLWLLKLGVWEDAGIWVDAAVWNDGV